MPEMGKHLTEEELDLVVNGAEINDLSAGHLGKCEYCKNRLQELKLFYEYWENDQFQEPVSEIESFVKHCQNKALTFVLNPMPEGESINYNGAPGRIVLAAKGEVLQKENEINIHTFSSAENKLVLRVEELAESSETNFYLLSGDNLINNRAIIACNTTQGGRRFIPLNKDGFASIKEMMNVEWGKLYFLLYIADKTLVFDSSKLEINELVTVDKEISFRKVKEMIFKFSFSSPPEKEKIFILLNDGNYFLNEGISRYFVIKLSEGQNIVEIRRLKQVIF
jgi:hypothetical protein